MENTPDLPNGMVGSGQEGPGPDIGALMRATRHRLGEEIQDAASTLRIRAAYLEAIEEGRFSDLPGPTYTVGFLRAYAEYLGLDGEEVVRRFKSASAETPASPQNLTFPTPVPDRGLPGGAILMVGILVAVIGYGGWYVYTSQDGVFAELVPSVPDRLTQMLDDGATKTRTVESGSTQPVNTAPPAAVAATPSARTALRDETANGSTADTLPAIDGPPPQAAVESEPLDDALAPAETAEAPMSAPESQDSADSNEISEPAPQQSGEQVAMVDATPADVAETTASERSASTDGAVEQPAAETEIAKLPAPAENPAPATPATEETPSVSSSDAPAAPAVPVEPAETAAPAPEAMPAVSIEVRAKADSWIQVRDDRADQLVLTRLLRDGDTYSVPARKGLTLLTGNAGALQIMVDGEAVPSIGPVGAVRRRVALDAQRLKDGTAVLE